MDLLLSLLFSIRWQDVLDIGLNSYILFRLYVVFRGTAVFRIIVGIAALWVFQRVSAAVGLIVTSWLMQGFTAFAALIILIIFKEEIRRVLSARDIKSLIWGLPHQMGHPPVETLVEGVFELARMHCGALLVLPGKLDLEEMLRSGIAWNGQLSRGNAVEHLLARQSGPRRCGHRPGEPDHERGRHFAAFTA
jgi:diadenylate cyclase